MQAHKLWHKFINNDVPRTMIHSITVDQAGSLYFVGVTNINNSKKIVLLKYASTGAELWRRYITGTPSIYGVHVVSDGKDNIYILGHDTSTWLKKFSSDGTELLHNEISLDLNNAGNHFVLDIAGNIYLSLSSWEHIESGDWSAKGDTGLLKLTADGTEVWQKQMSVKTLPMNYWASCMLAVDWKSNVYFLSFSETEATEPGEMQNTNIVVWLAKVSSDGTELWRQQISINRDVTWNGAKDTGAGVNVDEEGNIYLYISTEGVYQLIKLAPDGNELWRHQVGTGYNPSGGLAVDGLGNVYLAGSTIVQTISTDHVGNYSMTNQAWLAKFSPDGQRIWHHTFETGNTDFIDVFPYFPAGINSTLAIDGDTIYLLGSRDLYPDGYRITSTAQPAEPTQPQPVQSVQPESMQPQPEFINSMQMGQWVAKFHNVPETIAELDEIHRLRWQIVRR